MKFRKSLSRVASSVRKNPEKNQPRDDDTPRVAYASDWHAAVHNQEWDLLDVQLEKYRWEAESRKSRRSSSSTPSSVTLKKKYSSVMSKSSEFSRSDSLTTTDELGRTPLHLACEEGSPSKLVQKMASIESSALSMADEEGRFVIHIATKMERSDEDVAILIKGCPKSLVGLDVHGKSALTYAIEVAIGEENTHNNNDKDHNQYWGLDSAEHVQWQRRQEDKWKNVLYLLILMTEHKKAVLPKEQGRLIHRAMQAGAPLDVIENLISCSRNHQQTKIFARNLALCAKVINMLFNHNYPLSLLKKLLAAASYDERDPPKKILQALRRGLMRSYQAGFDWIVENELKQMLCIREEVIRFHRENRQQLVQSETVPIKQEQSATLKRVCQEWWSMLKFLLVYTSTRDPGALKSEHLLHVALSIPACPPSILELIVTVYPFSRKKEDPRSGALPVHIACRTWKNEKSQETEYSAEQVLIRMAMGESNSHWVWRRFQDRLPVHHAAAAGKLWPFLEPLVKLDTLTLIVRDPVTKLFPFQLAASKQWSPANKDGQKAPPLNKALILEAKSQFSTSQWQKLSDEEQNTAIATVSNQQDLKQLSAVFELLKQNPNAIGHGAIVPDTATNQANAIIGTGVLSSNFIGWCYLRNRKSGEWVVHSKRMDMIEQAINTATIPKEMSSWWNRMLTLVWESYSGELGFFQKSGKYLLHCAVANPDTPPILIEVLVRIFPRSVTVPVPGTTILPIHIAAATPTYASQAFELPGDRTSLQILFEATDTGYLSSATGRTLLHIAIDSGKTWDEVEPLLLFYSLFDARVVSAVDPETALLPFQLMARCRRYTQDERRAMITEAQRMVSSVNWADLSVSQKSRVLSRLHEKYECRTVGSTFELLRARPLAIQIALESSQWILSYDDDLDCLNSNESEEEEQLLISIEDDMLIDEIVAASQTLAQDDALVGAKAMMDGIGSGNLAAQSKVGECHETKDSTTLAKTIQGADTVSNGYTKDLKEMGEEHMVSFIRDGVYPKAREVTDEIVCCMTSDVEDKSMIGGVDEEDGLEDREEGEESTSRHHREEDTETEYSNLSSEIEIQFYVENEEANVDLFDKGYLMELLEKDVVNGKVTTIGCGDAPPKENEGKEMVRVANKSDAPEVETRLSATTVVENGSHHEEEGLGEDDPMELSESEQMNQTASITSREEDEIKETAHSTGIRDFVKAEIDQPATVVEVIVNFYKDDLTREDLMALSEEETRTELRTDDSDEAASGEEHVLLNTTRNVNLDSDPPKPQEMEEIHEKLNGRGEINLEELKLNLDTSEKLPTDRTSLAHLAVFLDRIEEQHYRVSNQLQAHSKVLERYDALDDDRANGVTENRKPLGAKDKIATELEGQETSPQTSDNVNHCDPAKHSLEEEMDTVTADGADFSTELEETELNHEEFDVDIAKELAQAEEGHEVADVGSNGSSESRDLGGDPTEPQGVEEKLDMITAAEEDTPNELAEAEEGYEITDVNKITNVGSNGSKESHDLECDPTEPLKVEETYHIENDAGEDNPVHDITGAVSKCDHADIPLEEVETPETCDLEIIVDSSPPFELEGPVTICAGIKRWRGIDTLLERTVEQHERVANQLREHQKVLEWYDKLIERRGSF